MKQVVMLGLAGLALAGCIPESRVDTNGPAPLPLPVESDSITYQTGPCFGRCPVYSVTVFPDGRGFFEGQRFTATTGKQAFRLSPAAYDAFAARLAPYRPSSGDVRYAPGEANCPNAPTDMPSVEVHWMRAGGDGQGLRFYLGCRHDNPALAEALGGAVELLPVGELIGPRP